VLTSAIASAAALAAVATGTHQPPDASPTAAAPAVYQDAAAIRQPNAYDYVNYYRSLAGLPAVGRIPWLESAVLLHDQYLANWAQACENISPHREQLNATRGCPRSPHATVAGNLAGSRSDILPDVMPRSNGAAITTLMNAPFHAIALLDPVLKWAAAASYYNPNATGRASFSGKYVFSIDVISGRLYDGYRGGSWVFPRDGATYPFTSYTLGNEWPDPLRTSTGNAVCTALARRSQVSAPIIYQWSAWENRNLSHPIIVDMTVMRQQQTCLLTAANYPAGSVQRYYMSGQRGSTKAAIFFAGTPFVHRHIYRVFAGGRLLSTFRAA
jgi:hypothetical protein